MVVSRLKRVVLRLLCLIKGRVWHARKLGVRVGQSCRLVPLDYGTEPFLIEIGDRVSVADGVRFLTHGGPGWLIRDSSGRRHRYAKIKIHNDVFIGTNAVIMPGVEIGSHVVVGAGSVVTRSIPEGVVVAGIPARVINSFQKLEEKVLEDWVSEKDMDRSLPFQEMVMSVVDSKMVKELDP